MRPTVFAATAIAVAAALASGGPALAGDDPSDAALRDAVRRGLALVERGATAYPTHRDCFSCHHQTLPMLAVVTAGTRGFEASPEFLDSQREFTRDSFASRLDSLRKGEGIGGRAMTVAYGLLALDLAGQPRDEVTDAMVTFLHRTQEPSGEWTTHARRPPMEESLVTSTALSMLGLDRFARGDQREPADAAIARGLAWIRKAPTPGQEDKAARLYALHRFGATPEEVAAAREAAIATRRDDGGWAQREGMTSDAYATGLTLAVLAFTGTPPDDPAYREGVRFLLETQLEDGSWFVETRSEPVQVFFDNGDPHGKSQFIALPATCWAVTALARALPDPAHPPR